MELDQREDGPAIQDEMLKITVGGKGCACSVIGPFQWGLDSAQWFVAAVACHALNRGGRASRCRCRCRCRHSQPHQMQILRRLAAACPALTPAQLLRHTPQGGRTVPRIFVYGQFIGGADDVTAKDASGELAALLKEKHLI